MSVRDKADIGTRGTLPRHGSWLAKSLWVIFGNPILTILLLALLGGLFGYFAAIRAEQAAWRHILVGAIFGSYLGIEFALSRTLRSKGRRVPVAALVGAMAGVALGIVLGRSPAELVVFSLSLAIAGAWGPALLRHVNFP